MLTLLNIKNFALIESLEINFSAGFSIITGETGAGKSILLGALGLLQGKRADLNLLKNKEQKCIVEGCFNVESYNLQELYSHLDLDYEPLTIIRREILPSGKSRAFVNDSPVNLNVLQELSESLIDIHSQHQTAELSDENYQIQVVDAVAGNRQLLENYQSNLKKYKKNNSALKSLKERRIELIKEQDYSNYLLEELQAADLIKLNQTELEEEYEKLNNVEFVRESFGQSLNLLIAEQLGVIVGLKEVRNLLQKTASFSKNYSELNNRVSSVEIELSDIAAELENQLEGVIYDPEQLSYVYERLQLLYALQKKHQVSTVDELLEIEEQLSEKIFLATDLEQKIEALEEEIKRLEKILRELAKKLSDMRKKAVPGLQKQLLDILKELGMPNAEFKFEFNLSANYLSNGTDEIQLLFSANKGTSYGLLKKVASGGEMSRIMLAIKAVLARYSHLPTIIFDEIDTGVSGEVADKMGEIMSDMSNYMQVFSITHLPQIAAKGKHHYKVFKESDEDTTTSKLVELNAETRVREIAQMLSGKDITDSALRHAKELLTR
jgi:DNA repair protein RecN (Recombination protein N)